MPWPTDVTLNTPELHGIVLMSGQQGRRTCLSLSLNDSGVQRNCRRCVTRWSVAPSLSDIWVAVTVIKGLWRGSLLSCRYEQVAYDCLEATTFLLTSHRVVIEWFSHLHQPIRFNYVIGTPTTSPVTSFRSNSRTAGALWWRRWLSWTIPHSVQFWYTSICVGSAF